MGVFNALKHGVLALNNEKVTLLNYVMFAAHQLERDVLILYRVHILAWAGRPFFSNSFPSCGIIFFLCLPFSGRVSWLATS